MKNINIENDFETAEKLINEMVTPTSLKENATTVVNVLNNLYDNIKTNEDEIRHNKLVNKIKRQQKTIRRNAEIMLNNTKLNPLKEDDFREFLNIIKEQGRYEKISKMIKNLINSRNIEIINICNDYEIDLYVLLDSIDQIKDEINGRITKAALIKAIKIAF